MTESEKGPVVIDIETAGQFDRLPDAVQQTLLEREERREADTEEPMSARERAAAALPLNPAAGIIVSIGMHTVCNGQSLVLVNSDDGDRVVKPDERFDSTWVYYGPEDDMLSKFWEVVRDKAGPGGRSARHPLVTFNGRAFDGPFLMLRSAVHGVKPSRHMVGYRYNLNDHCDLFDALSFMGSLPYHQRFSLDFWCTLLSIESPKNDMDGSQVEAVWSAGDLERLIRYSLADVQATAALYTRLEPLLACLTV